MNHKDDKDYLHFSSYASCHIIAAAINAVYGLPIVGVWADVGSGDLEWDEGEEDFLSLVHAFCAVGHGIGVDLDGKESREQIMNSYFGDEAEADQVVEFVGYDEFSCRVELDAKDVARAKEFVARYPEIYRGRA